MQTCEKVGMKTKMNLTINTQNTAQILHTEFVKTHSEPVFQAVPRCVPKLVTKLTYNTYNLVQIDKSLTPEFLKGLLKIECDTLLETYTKIKDEILKALGFKHPELLKLAFNKSIDNSGYEFRTGRILLAKSKTIPKERMIASIRHEIEHMLQALKIYKAKGKEGFASAMLKYRQNNNLTEIKTVENFIKKMDLEFFETMSKDVSIIGFDAERYYNALCKYKEPIGTLESEYLYITNLLEKDAYAITKRVLKALGQDTTLLHEKFFPANYTTMVELLNNKKIPHFCHEIILSELIDFAKVREATTPENFKRFLRIVKDARADKEVELNEKAWAEKLYSKTQKEAFDKKVGQKPFQQVETWLRNGIFTLDALIKNI